MAYDAIFNLAGAIMTTTRKTLATPFELRRALDDYAYRSRLIERLDTTPGEDSLCYEKKVLAFWLGSNVTLPDLKRNGYVSNYVYIGYYVMLAFDKARSAIGGFYPQIKDSQTRLLEYFNLYYAQLTESPKDLFTEFYNLLAFMPIGEPNNPAYEVMKEFARTCCVELSRVLNNNLGHPPINKPTTDLMAVFDEYTTNKRMTSFISARGMSRLFFKQPLNHAKELYPRACKLLLQAKDGTVLEAVYFKKSKQPAKAVTMISVGPFQPEFLYDRAAMVKFQQTFGTDVVFISHRNHSVRSAHLAEDVPQLASDFVVFADHFRKLGIEVHLYGMCGGGPAMIMAAKQLTDSHVPYKLILDRTYDSYIRLCSSKNAAHFDAVQAQTAPDDLYAFIFLKLRSYLYSIPYFEAWQNSQLATVDLELGEIVKSLPEYDVLTLEAKTKPEHQPQCADKFIGSDINIRRATKERRQEHKALLKELRDAAASIANELQGDAEVAAVFNSLRQAFAGCLQLISNEKLRMIGAPHRVMEYRGDLVVRGVNPFKLANEKRLLNLSDAKRVQDIHTEWLFTLTTRDTSPVSKMVKGFFAKMPKEWRAPFNQCKPYSSVDVCMLLFKFVNEATFTEAKRENIATKVSQFTKTLVENGDYLANISYRAFATGMPNLAEAVDKLNHSQIMQELNMERNAVSTRTF